MVIEQAKKELEKLEIQHPNSFQSLKFELRNFISQLEEEEEEKLSSPQYYSTTASTHVSWTGKKRKKGSSDEEEMRDVDEAESKLEVCKMLCRKRSCCDEAYGKRRDMNTVAAIERARVCLQKVQQLKTSFFRY
ncbi:hypothetical protein DCAR_0416810 [Daucus carota subsp. sativus]|uniref:Uncharacterized protein n=1 Tax=Daucus carota subsp. sativus TaxID=79200 RepID=A0A165XTF6_DAUCS|nr:PREDICTED: uncharacterized protein LOC108218122 [Daucus carota subsp. sativus]WOG97470.1 hypothetical protein DCAR_0416810 [Daucus carota subsp. sativus]